MITPEEIEILKKILFKYSLNDIYDIIGFDYKGKLVKSNELDSKLWDEIKTDIIETYKKNIQNLKYNKLRKKIELNNAKLGFPVPQDKLFAKENILYEKKSNTIIHKTSKLDKQKKPFDKKKKPFKTKKLSKNKIEQLERNFKRKIYLYFQDISYDKEIHKIYKSKASFGNIKNYLRCKMMSFIKKLKKLKTFHLFFIVYLMIDRKSKEYASLLILKKTQIKIDTMSKTHRLGLYQFLWEVKEVNNNNVISFSIVYK